MCNTHAPPLHGPPYPPTHARPPPTHSASLALSSSHLQGARSIAEVSLPDAAWISAVGAAGATIIGSAIIWPLMKKRVASFDALNASLPTTDSKDTSGNGSTKQQFADVTEDGFQQRVDDKLRSLCVEVAPEEKSIGSYFRRFRSVVCWFVVCASAATALHGVVGPLAAAQPVFQNSLLSSNKCVRLNHRFAARNCGRWCWLSYTLLCHT